MADAAQAGRVKATRMPKQKQRQKHKRITRRTKTGTFDSTFFVLVLILLAFGLVMLYSASYAYAYHYDNDSLSYIKKQAAFAVVGFIAMLAASKVDYHIWRKLAYVVFGAGMVLMLVAIILNWGAQIKRWIVIPGIGQFQPSEIVKFAVILVFARLISDYGAKMKTFRYGVLPFGCYLVSIAVLMMWQSHLSGTILILGLGMLMMFVGGTKLRYFGLLGGVAAAGLAGIVIIKGIQYMQERFVGWFTPFADPRDSTMQIAQSLLSIGAGGFMGVGLGQSRQKFLYLPEPQNDFIFAIICEELGFIGATAVIILFVLFIWRGFTVAAKAPDKFGMMLAAGITLQVAIQAALNIAVVTNTIPNTGISLPFFSYGGTSLLMLLGEMGVLLNVSRHAVMEKA